MSVHACAHGSWLRGGDIVGIHLVMCSSELWGSDLATVEPANQMPEVCDLPEASDTGWFAGSRITPPELGPHQHHAAVPRRIQHPSNSNHASFVQLAHLATPEDDYPQV